jgi:hypothetical protein
MRSRSLHARRGQTIGGGLRGGSERLTSAVTGASAITDATTDSVVTCPVGMTAAAAVQVARQALIETPSGQHGHFPESSGAGISPAQGAVIALAGSFAANAFTTGADSNSCAATRM